MVWGEQGTGWNLPGRYLMANTEAIVEGLGGKYTTFQPKNVTNLS